MMSNLENSTPLLIVTAVLFAMLGLYFSNNNIDIEQKLTLPTGLEKAVILPNRKTLSEFELVSHKGNKFQKADLIGHWSIVFFGFTNCPDICPTTMYSLKQVKQRLQKQNLWGNYQVIMVSVDPARDSIEKLSKYIPFYDEEFIGLRGTVEQTETFAKQLGIPFVANKPDSDGNYDVDHSAAIILINPQGKMAGVLSAPHKVDTISKDLAILARHYSSDHQPTPTQDSSLKSTAAQSNKTPNLGVKSDDGNTITIQNAWVRPPSPNASSLAAYLTIRNSGEDNRVISHMESPQFDEVMMHETRIENGLSSMNHLDQIELGANQTIRFEPMAKHLMLIDPLEELGEGATIEFVMSLENGETIEFTADVKQP